MRFAPDQVRALEVGALEVGVLEVRLAEVSAREERLAQARVLEVSPWPAWRPRSSRRRDRSDGSLRLSSTALGIARPRRSARSTFSPLLIFLRTTSAVSSGMGMVSPLLGQGCATYLSRASSRNDSRCASLLFERQPFDLLQAVDLAQAGKHDLDVEQRLLARLAQLLLLVARPRATSPSRRASYSSCSRRSFAVSSATLLALARAGGVGDRRAHLLAGSRGSARRSARPAPRSIPVVAAMSPGVARSIASRVVRPAA